MTEYEAASLAVQQDMLTLQQSTLALQQASLAVQRAAVWVAALVGAAQCALIACGLYIMRQAAKHRDAQHRETMAALNAQREAQSELHRENMEALRELIRRTSAPPDSHDG